MTPLKLLINGAKAPYGTNSHFLRGGRFGTRSYRPDRCRGRSGVRASRMPSCCRFYACRRHDSGRSNVRSNPGRSWLLAQPVRMVRAVRGWKIPRGKFPSYLLPNFSVGVNTLFGLRARPRKFLVRNLIWKSLKCITGSKDRAERNGETSCRDSLGDSWPDATRVTPRHGRAGMVGERTEHGDRNACPARRRRGG